MEYTEVTIHNDDATNERRYLARQVPFIVWDEGLACGTQTRQPASHGDMFPTLFPLLGIGSGYVRTGRNLLEDSRTQKALTPLSLQYFGSARSVRGSWNLGDVASFMCTPVGAASDGPCVFDPALDAQARARLGLLDWNVRNSLRQQGTPSAVGKSPP